MRIPVRSETDALYVTCGIAALIAASVILGAFVDPIAGLALFVGGVAGAVFWELEEARERLAAALAWAREEGLEADGKVGDPFTAFGAVEDELRAFGADEVIVSTLPPGRSNWLEAGILERLRDELDVPITHVVVDQEIERP